MADADSSAKKRHLVSEKNNKKASKLTSHFVYKAVIVAIFLVIIPLFPSEAPEFIDQTILTRGWELLHLLFVGIAVSYGLFGRRNDGADKEYFGSKFDNAQSYVSRFLQVSSVFDDETENESKVQTWSSQYQRNEAMLMVAQDQSAVDEQRKPLLLPVRSLKSRVSDARESLARSGSISGSKRLSRNPSVNSSRTRNGDLGLEEDSKESVVLPSPIPWRSRSGMMEGDAPPLYNLPPPMEDTEFTRPESRSFRSQTSRSSRPTSANSSPSIPSPHKSSPMPSSEKKSHCNLSPPPPPPPPPAMRKWSSMKASSSSIDDGVSAERDLRRSFTRPPRSPAGRSVRTSRAGSWNEAEAEYGTGGGKESSLTEERGRKSLNSDQTSFWTEWDGESEKVDGTAGERQGNEDAAAESVQDDGPDVDKKADEFIAKFREQIRLQRIQSIKRSSGNMSRNSAR